MGKTILILLVLLMVSSVMATNYEYIYNPYTAKQDRSVKNLTGFPGEYWVNESGDTMTGDLYAPSYLTGSSGFVVRASSGGSIRLNITQSGDLYTAGTLYNDGNIRQTGEYSLYDAPAWTGDRLIHIYDSSDDGIIDVLQNAIIIIQLNGTSGIVTAPYFDGNNSQWTRANSTHVYLTGSLGSPTDTNAVGIGTTTPNGLQIESSIIEATRGTSNIRMGVHIVGTPRLIFDLGAQGTQWEMDNSGGTLRFFQPGTVYMRLSNTTLKLEGGLEFDGDQNWTDNQNYPVACPTQSYITELGDSVTCTSAASSHNSTSWNRSGTLVSLANVGDDVNISEGNLYVGDHIYLGTTESDHKIYFYDAGSSTSESIMWNEVSSFFSFTDDIYSSNSITASGNLLSNNDIYTTSTGDDLWLGTSTQNESNFKAYADGRLNMSNNLNVGGNSTFDGYIHMGTDTKSVFGFVSEVGDIATSGNIFTDGVITNFAPPYGIGYAALNNEGIINITSLGGTATLNATTQYLCDTTNPFVAGNKNMFFTVISSIPDYNDATGEIMVVVNSSCVRLSFASAGSNTVVDATAMTYYVYPHPIFTALDNGFISSWIGPHPDSQFEIHILNGTGPNGVYIEDVAGADAHQTLTIETDIKGFDGIVGYNSYLTSSESVAGIKADNMKLEINPGNINLSELAYISMTQIGLAGKNTVIDALHIDPLVNHIIHMGSYDVLNRSYNESTDITAVRAGTPYTVLTNDNDILYVGDDLDFTIMSFDFTTPSSADLDFNYFYCNDTGGYEPLTEVIDTTNGFKVPGTISFTNPTDRGKCHNETDGTPFADTTNYTYIAIQRTRNLVVTPPTLDRITIGGGSNYFLLTSEYMKLNPTNTAPEDCPTDAVQGSMIGAIYFDISEDNLCVCKTTGWKVAQDGSACT